MQRCVVSVVTGEALYSQERESREYKYLLRYTQVYEFVRLQILVGVGIEKCSECEDFLERKMMPGCQGKGGNRGVRTEPYSAGPSSTWEYVTARTSLNVTVFS